MLEIIKLLDADGNIIDSVSGEYEDSFCLDSFSELVKSHNECDPIGSRGFIIARVQTLDPKQPDKAFYSYYNAYHLNKVLFQTQICSKKKYIHRLHVLNPLTNSDIIGHVQYYLVDNASIPKPEEVAIKIEETKENLTTSRPKTLETIQENDWTLSEGAYGSVEEEEPESIRKMQDPNEDTLKPRKTIKIMRKETQDDKEKLVKVTVAVNETNTSLVIDAKPPVSPTKPRSLSKTKIVPGIITRFNIPVPADQLDSTTPATQKERRRSLSYQNALSATGEKASVEEWIQMIQNEGNGDTNNFDVVPSPAKKTPSTLQSSVKSIAEKVSIIKAKYIGNDNDYLSTSKMRSVFKANAIQPDDVKLFEMPPTNTPDSEILTPADSLFTDECYLCSPPPQSALQNSTKCVRLFHRFKCIFMAIIAAGLIQSFAEIDAYEIVLNSDALDTFLPRDLMPLNRIACTVKNTNVQCLVAGSDIKLYQSSESDGLKCTQIITDFSQVKSASWASQIPDMAALGMATGRVTLIRFQENNNFTIAGEIIHQARPCTTVSFSPSDLQVLCGLDKVRGDCGLFIWDSTQIFAKNTDHEPIAQFGISEGTSSAAWYPYGDRIVAGMGYKNIRCFDVRDKAMPIFTIASRAVHGISFDYFNLHQFASYADDSTIKIWDDRKTTDPVLSFPTDFRVGLTGISWCPSQSGLLASIGKDSRTIRLWSVKHLGFEQEIIESPSEFDIQEEPILSNRSVGSDEVVLYNKRKLKPFSSQILDFCWIPNTSSKSEAKYLVLTKDSKIEIHTLASAPISTVSPKGDILAGHSSSILLLSPMGPADEFEEISEGMQIVNFDYHEDISYKMMVRAKAGYMFDATRNISIFDSREDLELINVWTFVKAVMENNGKGKSYSGIREMIEQFVGNDFSSKAKTTDPGVGFLLTTYDNKYRRDILGIIAPYFNSIDQDNESSFTEYINNLVASLEYEKAGALLFFAYGDLGKTIDCLNSSQDEKHLLIAAALAGATPNSNHKAGSAWRIMCSRLMPRISNPYLRILFGLLATGGDWMVVLEDSSLPLLESIAIATRFLDNSDLSKFSLKKTNALVKKGSLEGFLLTGWTSSGIDLLSNYVDITGDVQTAALILNLNFGAIKDDERFLNFTSSFKDLLGKWQLYHIRAKFDVLRNPIQKIPPQVYVRCNYCNSSISPAARTKKPPVMGIGGFHRSGMTACQNCKKSLPACSICLAVLGTPIDGMGEQSKFNYWFTWCQTCKHGGHAIHLFEWFKEHGQCPVAGCDCVCNQR